MSVFVSAEEVIEELTDLRDWFSQDPLSGDELEERQDIFRGVLENDADFCELVARSETDEDFDLSALRDRGLDILHGLCKSEWPNG